MRVFIDPDTGAERYTGTLNCNGLCLWGADVGVPEYNDIAYPHPECVLHSGHDVWPDEVSSWLSCENVVEELARCYFQGTVH